MTLAEPRRSCGISEPSASRTDRACEEPAGCRIAVAGKLIVAGGIGATSDRIPPLRTSTVTATRRVAAMCLAVQLSGATATTMRLPATLYTTPLDRGSPAGVT